MGSRSGSPSIRPNRWLADVTRFAISTFAAAAAAMMFALACYAPLRSLIAAALAGGIGWAAFGALTCSCTSAPVVATGSPPCSSA